MELKIQDSHGTTLSVSAYEAGRQKAQVKAFITGDHDASSNCPRDRYADYFT